MALVQSSHPLLPNSYHLPSSLPKRLPRAVNDKATSCGLIITSKGQYTLDSAWPKPAIVAANEVRIKIQAVGLNPIDWKSVEWNFCLPSFPWTIGREASGVVESIGSGVTHIKVGDEVWTSKLIQTRPY